MNAMVCPPVREIIHSLKLVDYLLVNVHKPLYNFYLSSINECTYESYSHMYMYFLRDFEKNITEF